MSAKYPTHLGTIPFALGYMSLVILWSNRADNWLKQRLRAVGKMALTNYLMQTVLGVIVLDNLAGRRGFCEQGCRPGVCACSVGASTVVVAGVAESFHLRTCRVALASRYISKRTATPAAPATPGAQCRDVSHLAVDLDSDEKLGSAALAPVLDFVRSKPPLDVYNWKDYNPRRELADMR